MEIQINDNYSQYLIIACKFNDIHRFQNSDYNSQ